MASYGAQRTEITPALGIWVGIREAIFAYCTHLFYSISETEGGRGAKKEASWQREQHEQNTESKKSWACLENFDMFRNACTRV